MIGVIEEVEQSTSFLYFTTPGDVTPRIVTHRHTSNSNAQEKMTLRTVTHRNLLPAAPKICSH